MKHTLIGISAILNVVLMFALGITWAAKTGQIKAYQIKNENKDFVIETQRQIIKIYSDANDSCMCYTGEKERTTKIRERMKKQEKFDKSK